MFKLLKLLSRLHNLQACRITLLKKEGISQFKKKNAKLQKQMVRYSIKNQFSSDYGNLKVNKKNTMVNYNMN